MVGVSLVDDDAGCGFVLLLEFTDEDSVEERKDLLE